MKKKSAADDMDRITLKLNDTVISDHCAFCNGIFKPDGFDYVSTRTGELVCDQCANKYAPEMAEIRRAALKFAETQRSRIRVDIRRKIIDAMLEPIQNRIMKALDQIDRDEELPF